MIQFKHFLVLSTCFTISISRVSLRSRNSLYNSNYENPSESYVGPSSYTTSFGGDYPGYGNYGSYMNLRNPQISSSYMSFGPSSENDGFSSTSYVNYPQTTVNQGSFQHQSNSAYSTSQQWPEQPQSSSINSDAKPISQHIEITKPVAVPVYKRFPYPVAKRFPVAIPHPVLVPIPAPYPVNVAVSQPVAIPIIKEVRIPIEKEVLYPVEKKVFVTVDKPVQYQVEKHYPVYVPKPYPVKVPIIKTVIHKGPKKW